MEIKYKETAALIAEECEAVKQLLIKKNEAYGDSAINPQQIFSRAHPEELIRVRIDDKLNRLKNNASKDDAFGEDVEQDLMGYLILLRVARRLRKIRANPMDQPAYERPFSPVYRVENGNIDRTQLAVDKLAPASQMKAP